MVLEGNRLVETATLLEILPGECCFDPVRGTNICRFQPFLRFYNGVDLETALRVSVMFQSFLRFYN